MAGVVNDIEALAEFRAQLMRFNHDLAENLSYVAITLATAAMSAWAWYVLRRASTSNQP